MAAAMSAYGRKRTLISRYFQQIERPVSGKADIQLILVKRSANDPLRTFLEPSSYVTIRDFVIAAYDDGVSVSTKQVLGP